MKVDAPHPRHEQNRTIESCHKILIFLYSSLFNLFISSRCRDPCSKSNNVDKSYSEMLFFPFPAMKECTSVRVACGSIAPGP